MHIGIKGLAAVSIAFWALPATAEQNIEAGAEAFRKCSACHMVGEDAANRSGPVLNGILGRPLAARQDYPYYSDAMQRAAAGGLVWDIEHLELFIENPKSLISGTTMMFSGISDPEERGHLIAFLDQFSDGMADIPEVLPARDPVVSPEILAIEGDPAYGEYLSGECVICHQLDGRNDGIPAIVGWLPEDFVIALHAYKSGYRTNEVMVMTAQGLSDEEIAALAAYFETLGETFE